MNQALEGFNSFSKRRSKIIVSVTRVDVILVDCYLEEEEEFIYLFLNACMVTLNISYETPL